MAKKKRSKRAARFVDSGMSDIIIVKDERKKKAKPKKK